MIYLYATLAGVVAYGLRLWGRSIQMDAPPDAITYMYMSRGDAVANPFRLRWLMPTLIKERPNIWIYGGASAWILTAPLIAWFAELHGINGLWASLIWVALPIQDIVSSHAGTIDPFAWLVALLTACLSVAGFNVAAIICVCLAGMIAPKAVIFSALWALNPWLLLGIAPVIIAHLLQPTGEPIVHPEIIKHPWKSSMNKNGPLLHDYKNLLAPWGICLVGLMTLPLMYVPVVVIAYAQMFRAVDMSRLYMWAAPVLIIFTVPVIPEQYLLIAVLGTWFNPFRPKV